MKHSMHVGASIENRCNDPGGFGTRTKDILVNWNKIFGGRAVKVEEVAYNILAIYETLHKYRIYSEILLYNANSFPRLTTL